MHSLVPRPSTPPIFDHLQFAKLSRIGGVEGLGQGRLIIMLGILGWE